MLELETLGVLHESSSDASVAGEFADIRVQSRLHRLAVRGPSYDWQEERTVLDLFDADHIRSDVVAAAGFSAPVALKAADAVTRLGLERLQSRADRARYIVDAIIDDLRNARERRPLNDARNAQLIQGLEGLSFEAAREALHARGVAWTGFRFGDTMSFTAGELARYAGCDIDETKAFLQRFAVAFGEFRAEERSVDIETIRNRPILRDSEGHFLCFSQHNLHWGIRPGLEEALKNAGDKVWSRYERHRRQVVEQRALSALTKALRADWSHGEIHYETVEDDQKRRPEVDGLACLDSIVVVVEAKGSSMRPSARRGAPAALRDWLTREVSKAASQARRTSRVLLAESGAPAFFRLDW